jgi:hypothetical protein
MNETNNTFLDATLKLERATRGLDTSSETNWEKQTSQELYWACQLFISKYELRKTCVSS